MSPIVLKICLLGSTSVGKTKLLKQFVDNYYDDDYEPTRIGSSLQINHDNIINCSTTFNGTLYHLKLIDMPAIRHFPKDLQQEWLLFKQSLLTNCNAYIFVFDLNQPITFHYVKTLRDQLFESRNMQNIPVWIVGNKADLCLNVLATIRSHHHHQTNRNRSLSNQPSTIKTTRTILSASAALVYRESHQQILSPYEDLTPACKEFSNLVRKQWKCNYLECSAKYNWRVVTVFRELLKSIDPLMLSYQQQQIQQNEMISSSIADVVGQQSTMAELSMTKIDSVINTSDSGTLPNHRSTLNYTNRNRLCNIS